MPVSSNNLSTTPRLVIVGNGMVAGRFLDELLKRGAESYDITVIGEEHHGSYNRIMLSAVLADDTDLPSIVQKNHDWYARNRVRLLSGVRALSIDRKNKFVYCDNGEQVHYDELVIATGSRAATIPAQIHSLQHVYVFRTIDDTQAIMSKAHKAKRVVVVGGGLLGLEAAYGLSKMGVPVTLVHRGAWLLNRQLDEAAASMLKRVMQAMHITFELNCEITSFQGDDRQHLTSIKLSNNKVLAADMAVIATGIRPNAELGAEAGLVCNKAINVDEVMLTSDPAISAVGECVEHKGHTFGLVDPLWRQAASLAARLSGASPIRFDNVPVATKLKVSGVHVFSAGKILNDSSATRSVILSDENAHIYRKLILHGDIICGVVLFGDVSGGQFYFDLMQQRIPIHTLLPNLLVGERFIDAAQHKEITAQLYSETHAHQKHNAA